MKVQSGKWRDLHIGLIIFLFLAVNVFHYSELLVGVPIWGEVFTSLHFVPRHAVELFTYVLIAVYASWALGITWGGAIWIASVPLMLTQAVIVAPNPKEALVEGIFALVLSGLVVAFARVYWGLRQQKEVAEEISAALRASQERYEALFDDAIDAIWVHDLAGKIIMANRACERLLGYPPSELIGDNAARFLSPEALILAREVKAQLMRDKTIDQRYEQRMVRKDNTEAIVEITTRLMKVDGEPTAFQHIARDVTEERKLRESLRVQIHKTLIAQEEERKRIARELHDDIAQAALLASRRLDILIAEDGRKLAKTTVSELERVHSITDDIYKSLQRYARDLRPGILDQMGLVAALNWLSEELAKELAIKAEVRASALPPLPPDTELVMFRIAQEALNNIRKHSEASDISITLELKVNEIKMTVTDNGRGFAISRLTEDLAKEGKLGILGMQERARLIGGRLEISSEPGKGTNVIAKVPV